MRVQGDPDDRRAVGRCPPDQFSQQRGLAEPRCCQQHGGRPVEQRSDGLVQGLAHQIVAYLLRSRHLGREQLRRLRVHLRRVDGTRRLFRFLPHPFVAGLSEDGPYGSDRMLPPSVERLYLLSGCARGRHRCAPAAVSREPPQAGGRQPAARSAGRCGVGVDLRRRGIDDAAGSVLEAWVRSLELVDLNRTVLHFSICATSAQHAGAVLRPRRRSRLGKSNTLRGAPSSRSWPGTGTTTLRASRSAFTGTCRRRSSPACDVAYAYNAESCVPPSKRSVTDPMCARGASPTESSDVRLWSPTCSSAECAGGLSPAICLRHRRRT